MAVNTNHSQNMGLIKLKQNIMLFALDSGRIRRILGGLDGGSNVGRIVDRNFIQEKLAHHILHNQGFRYHRGTSWRRKALCMFETRPWLLLNSKLEIPPDKNLIDRYIRKALKGLKKLGGIFICFLLIF